MLTTLTVEMDPEMTWQQKALAALQQALGQPLELWTYRQIDGWVPQHQNSGEEFAAPQFAIDHQLLAMIERVARSGKPVAHQQQPGHYLFAVSLGERAVATTCVQTDRPEILLGLAGVAANYFRQQEEVVRLREENDFFLKQVSDDFEELTFLRAMAERLGLGDDTHTIDQLIRASLPDLGKSAHAEELYFVLNLKDEPLLLSRWHADRNHFTALADSVILQVVEEHRESAAAQPIIKNGVDASPANANLPGVRDFVMVPVVGATGPFGWFLAVNRRSEAEELECGLPEWRLSQHEFGTSEASLLSTAAAMTASHANNLSLFQEREVLLVNVVRTLVSAIEAKDDYTCGHSERVALYGKSLARQVGYDEAACELLYLTGLLHDVGKIAINDAILNKTGHLTDEEFAEIQQHPEEGWRILQGLKQLSYVLPGVLHHHERIDGKGYPDGLAKQDIPLDGRVLAVADAYDAMTSNRAYRTGMPHGKAVEILRDGAGTQWDTEVVNAFLQILPEITTIRENYLPRHQVNRVAAPALAGAN